MRSSPILVVGSFVQDLTFATSRFPGPGETVVGKFLTGPGGKGSNQAIAARRAGAEVTFIGAVGKDSFADSVRKFYEEEGVNAPLAEYGEQSTGTAGILFDDSGQNEIVVALGANDLLSPEDIPTALIESSEIIVCQLECNLEAVQSVFSRASQPTVTRILNPAPFRAEFPQEILDDTDILIPNETEFLALLDREGVPTPAEEDLPGLSPADFDSLCRKLKIETVLVTMGKNGVHISTPDGFERIPAVAGLKVVDTTGAGDAFVGAFAAGLQRFDHDLTAAARFATKAAGLSVTRQGTAPAMARLEEIESLSID